jgi:predicted nucleic-acid-binding Zn-ribbon protein
MNEMNFVRLSGVPVRFFLCFFCIICTVVEYVEQETHLIGKQFEKVTAIELNLKCNLL